MKTNIFDKNPGPPNPRGGKKEGTIRIAIVVSHPIQHFCPQYVSFAQNENVEVKVFFGSSLGYKKYVDENFKLEISWGNLQLDQFDHVFLNGMAVLPSDKNLDAVSLETELESFNPELVFVYGYFQKLQRRAYAWAKKNKIPLAYISDSELRHTTHLLKQQLKAFFLRRYFSKISWFLTVGDANEAFYKKHGVAAEKLLRMHFPIDLKQYKTSYLQKASLRQTIRKKYGIGETDIVVAVVGKLSPWKSQDHLIDAMQLLEKQGICLNLFVLGSGETKDLLHEKANGLKKSRVYFPGFVNIEELPAYYAAADIYAHPASLEPHSIAISEAIYMGCPIVLSDRCGSYGVTDDVQVGRNGLVYEYGNIAALAGKLKILASDKNMREQFGMESHSIAAAFQENAHYYILRVVTEQMRKKNA